MSAIYPSLATRRVLVTGGASGIGADLVRAFAGQKSRVTFLDIDDSAAAAAPAGTTYRHCDLTDIAALRAAIDELGPFDVLVNNAARDDRHEMAGVEPEDRRRALAVNLDHQFFATQRVAPAMAANGGGAVIFTSSVSWKRARPGMVAYTTAKAAIAGLTRTMARELGPQGIRVNCIVPGPIRTERQAKLWRTPEADAEFLRLQALKFHLDGTHVARAALFLASDEAAGMTGTEIVVDAGVTLELTTALALALRGRTVLLHTRERPAFAVGHGEPLIEMNRGNFRLADRLGRRTPLPCLAVAGDELRFAAAPGEPAALVWRLEQGTDAIRLVLRHAAPGINRVWLSLPAEAGERVRGGGEQFSHLDLRGRRFPLWTSEPGIGRDKTTAVTQRADREAGAGGDYWTTTYPQPTFLSDRLHALHVETTAYAAFDFTAPDRHEIEIWAPPDSIHLLAAGDHASLVRRLSDLFGRARPLPDWAMGGAIIGMKGGGLGDGGDSFARLERILAAGAAVSALWCEDWAGVRETGFGTRLFWDWRWNERRYPALPDRIAELARRGMRFLAYANPYLAADGTLYPEALAAGLLARAAGGGAYDVDFGEFRAGIVDFTNPEAAAWFAARILMREMLDIGIGGWMADFGEYLPTDAVLANADPLLAHNAWPTLWAGVNAEALAAHPRGHDALFFMRAGYTGIQRHCPLLWAGDQCVDFSRHDGLSTTITAALSAGLVGNRFHHSDIGGYTSLYGLARTPELLRRWIELAAFTPVMRTHEGNRPRDNLQIDGDPAVLAEFARFTRLHATLAPYLRAVAAEAETGLPAQRPLFLHFPRDPEAAAIEDEYLLGPDLLVAPVHAAGRDRWEAYLPAGADWRHLWSGAVHRGGRRVVVDAPLGRPPVFSRLGSPHAPLFAATAAAAAPSADPEQARDGRQHREDRRQHQGGPAPGHDPLPLGQAQHHGGERRADRLAGEPRGGQHAAARAGAPRRRARQQQPPVGRLEEPVAAAHQHHAEPDAEHGPLGGKEPHQHQPQRHHQHAHAAEPARRDPVGQPAGDRGDHGVGQRPGRQQQPGRHLRRALGLEQERQRHIGQRLGSERADRGADRKREDRPRQQIDRQQRQRQAQLPAHEDPAHDEQRRRAGGQHPEPHRAAELVEHEDEQQHRRGVEHHARHVERMAGERRPRQRAGHRQRHHAQRHVDREQHRPVRHGKDRGGDARPRRRGNRDHQGIEPERAAEMAGRKHEAQQRRVDARHPGTAQPLDRARRDQEAERRRKRAGARRRGEHDEPGDEDPPEADDVAQRRAGQQGHHHRKLERVDHPDRGRRRHREPPGHGRQRDIGDGAVQHRHRDPDADRGHGPPARAGGQSVILHRPSIEWLRGSGNRLLRQASLPAIVGVQMANRDPTTARPAQPPSSRALLPPAPGVPGRLGYLVRNRRLLAAIWLLDHLPWPRRVRLAPAQAPPRRLLVAMIGNFGDAVIASAALERILAAAPQTELGLLASPVGAALFRGDPRLAHLHVIDHYWLSRAPVSRWTRLRRHAASRRAVIRELREVGYDAAIDLYFPFPSVAPIPWAAGIPRRVGYASNGFRRFLTHAEPWVSADRHVADYQAALLPLLGFAPAALAAAGPPRPALPALRSPPPVTLPRHYVVLHMGAGARSREWPEKRWLAVASALAARGRDLVLTGRGEREAERCARVANAVRRAIDLSDRLDPAQLRAVLGRAALLICLDSFAGHLAALDAVPSVVLTTGVANPAQWRPLNAGATVLVSRTPCLPCYNWRGCAVMACIREVTEAQVLAVAWQKLGIEPA